MDRFREQARVPDIEQFSACTNEARSSRQVVEGKTIGDAIGVQGTPTVIVNGWMLPAPPSPEHFDKIVNNINDGRAPIEDLY